MQRRAFLRTGVASATLGLLLVTAAVGQTARPANPPTPAASAPVGAAPTPSVAPTASPPADPTGAPSSAASGAVLDPRSLLQKAMTAGAAATTGTIPAGDSELRFGMTGPFSGPSREFGRQLSEGIDTAFRSANDAGGIAGRKLKLITADDGYEPSRTPDLVRKLVEQDHVVGMVGSFGTPNAQAVLPWLQERRVLFYAPFTGAPIVRASPPDVHTFNFRPSYAEETEAAVRYLVNVRGIKPNQIAVFAQDDGFGQAGYDGAAKALRALANGRYEQPPLYLKYKRNTIDVADAVATLKRLRYQPRAVIMVALYRPAAKFIENLRPTHPDMIFTNVSAVGSSGLAEELALLGPKFADGVVVTQVVPAANGYSKIVTEFKDALARYFPGEQPDYLSLEGFVEAKLLIEGLRRVGSGPVDGDKIANALESMSGYDAGLGTPVAFSPSDHQAIHVLWGTVLDGTGHYKPIDLK